MTSVPAVRRLAHLAARDEPAPDAELLRRYVAAGDSGAFAALVGRHGPMVLAVCRRVTRDGHAADDAFQAVFLGLARRAGAIRSPEALPGWLFATARRAALRARDRSGRPAGGIPPGHPAAGPDPLDALSARELLQVLDEELARLPTRYRSAILLCTVDGLAVEAAARHLGTTPGAVRGWLQRGRERLRRRLERRGLSLSAALALAAVGCPGPPDALAAAAAELGRSPASARTAVAALAPRPPVAGKLVAVALAVAAVVATGLAFRAGPGRPPQGPPGKEAPPAAAVARAAPGSGTDQFGDPLPAGVVARLGTMRLRHGENAFALAYSPDGKELASGGTDGVIHVWDTATGRERMRLTDGPGPAANPVVGAAAVMQVAFSPDGRYLAAARMNQPPSLWDARTGAKVREFGGPGGRANWVQFSPDGKYLALAGAAWQKDPNAWAVAVETGDEVAGPGPGSVLFGPAGHCLRVPAGGGAVTLHRLPGGAEVRRFEAPGGPATSAAVSGDRTRLFTLGADKAVRAWDLDTGKELARLDGAGDGARILVADGPGKAVLTLGQGADRIALWDVGTGKRRWEVRLDARRDKVTSATFLPTGEVLTGHEYGMLRAWDPATGREARAVQPQSWGAVFLALAPDGRTVATAVNNRYDVRVALTDTATFKPAVPAHGHDVQVFAAAFHPGGRLVATGGWDETIRLWEPRTGRAVKTIEAPAMGGLEFAPDGRRLFATGWSDGRVRVYDADAGKLAREWDSGSRHLGAMALSADGRVLVTAGDTLRAWDAAGGTLVREFEAKARPLYVAVSTDGETVAATGVDGVLRIYDRKAAGPRHEVTNPAGKVGAIALSPDGRLLAWSDERASIVLAEVATGRTVRTLAGRANTGDTLVFSPDGKTLAWGTMQGYREVRLWDVRAGQVRRTLLGHDGWARTLAYSPDGSLLLTAGPDGAALVWDVHGSGGPRRDAAPAELADWWGALAGADAAGAYTAMTSLRDAGPAAVALIRDRLPPMARPDPKTVAALVARLGSDSFKEREAASRELAGLGEAAAAALREVEAGGRVEEARARARRLLQVIEDGRMVPERAVEVLEMMGDREAARLLTAYAAGPPGAPLTEDAAAALKRLSTR
jgi:RNA polymerase sigma factor (sigma-70 family)